MDPVLKTKLLKDLKTLNKNKFFMAFIEKCDDETVICKSPLKSDKLREKGNKLLAKGNLDNKQRHKVLALYNESIAFAPIGSEEMAKTYANRSALLYDLRKYKESISEADKALRITNLVFLKVKLLCRKAECLTALGSSENRSYLEKAKFILNKSEDPPKIKEMLSKVIKDAVSVIDDGKLDKPRENKRMAEVSKLIADEESKDIWKNVDIKITQKYGKRIVAARDFEPGEIVWVGKPYHCYLRESRRYQYCYKCFKYLWTVVPCDHCCWRIYCSEECKNEAWDEYHDLECPVMSQIKFALCWVWHELISSLLGMFFKVLKKAGGIDQLLVDFNSAAQGDQCDKVLDHKIIFASPTGDIGYESTRTFMEPVAVTLVGLAKYTTILGKSYNFNGIEKLMKNKTAITVGCLLMKLSTCVVVGGVDVKLIDPTVQNGSYEEKQKEMEEGEDPQNRSYSFNIIGLLTLQGCIPNIDNCPTAGYKSVLYAISPIKAGSPFFLYNHGTSVYHGIPKHERQLNHQRNYKCPCDCQACTEDWPEKLGETLQIPRDPWRIDWEALRRWTVEYDSVVEELYTHISVHKPNYPDLKTMTRAYNCAREGWKHFPVPSPMMKNCIDMVITMTFLFHSPVKNLFTTSEST